MKFREFKKKLSQEWHFNKKVEFNFEVIRFCDKGITLRWNDKKYSVSDIRKYFSREIKKGEKIQTEVVCRPPPPGPYNKNGKLFIEEQIMPEKSKPSILKELKEKVKLQKKYKFGFIEDGMIICLVPTDEGEIFHEQKVHWIGGKCLPCGGEHCDMCIDNEAKSEWSFYAMIDGEVKIIKTSDAVMKKIMLMIEDIGEEDFMPPIYREFQIEKKKERNFTEYFLIPQSKREFSKEENKQLNKSHSLKNLINKGR